MEGFVILFAGIVVFIFAPIFFPVWLVSFIVTLPFRKTSRRVNLAFLQYIYILRVGVIYDECDRCNYDGSSYCTKECNEFHDEIRKYNLERKERWDNGFWGWFERIFSEPIQAKKAI